VIVVLVVDICVCDLFKLMQSGCGGYQTMKCHFSCVCRGLSRVWTLWIGTSLYCRRMTQERYWSACRHDCSNTKCILWNVCRTAIVCLGFPGKLARCCNIFDLPEGTLI